MRDWIFLALILICLLGGFMRFLDWCRDIGEVISDVRRSWRGPKRMSKE